MEELGKLEKPAAEQFKEGRRLYLVPLVFAGEDSPADYLSRVESYWQGAEEHLRHLEARIGKTKRVYHEIVYLPGEEGLELIKRLNQRSYQIVESRCKQDAAFEATEDKELADESLDWQRCLMIGFASQKVVEKISEFYVQTTRKRYEHIARRIDESLGAGEAGLLLIREDHWVQFPPDIQVFHVSPPALDGIHRWLRDRLEQNKKET